ncbi:hypothetical protein Sp245p_12205 [Azospirillum baldaniorum]|uniref:Uncharacterized protein n=1 Tax=Azospirillum baldaniorum TaxID=1064539 RepID=A0A9P1NLD6_9PROT|nr:ATP-binding protein [Azospirillum baldaniorum]AWJ90495.1 hypothetical protein Sp245p_12205 [Azospirillum baldaniorum]TWA55933.1 AAA domain-containing protein [Azospirillum baldaniorum]TWA67801.1 AAA domain-containing protein [Azospirillum brasilense]CCC97344.1 protein of unknown function [Azospirillum baldaniorum]
MKQLVRIGMINWHLLPAVDIAVTADVGVIGENRSGKSTLLNLTQLVITGNNGRIFASTRAPLMRGPVITGPRPRRHPKLLSSSR